MAPSTGLLLQQTRLVTWRGWGVLLEGQVGAKLEGLGCDVGGVGCDVGGGGVPHWRGWGTVNIP